MLEPRTVPDEPVATLAVQSGPQPTRKVTSATNAAGTAGGVIAAIFTTFGGDSIHELWVLAFGAGAAPMTEKLVTALIVFGVSTFAVRWLGRVAAYNVLDLPNVPLAPVSR